MDDYLFKLQEKDDDDDPDLDDWIEEGLDGDEDDDDDPVKE